MLSVLPLDVGIGKMLVIACILTNEAFNLLEPAIILAAGLNISSPFIPVNQNSEGEREELQLRQLLESEHGIQYFSFLLLF